MQIGSCFLTGTDTEIGKTHVACALLRYWQQQGFAAAGYKPVAAGGEWKHGQLVNEDAERLLWASSSGVSITEINPVCLQAAIAPHIAARDEGQPLLLPSLLEGFTHLAARFDKVVVEGVGGFKIPLGAEFDSTDLAVALGLPVVLVVGLRLGCINHALLSVEAILARKLTLAGWVGNSLYPTMARQADTVAALKEHIPTPCLGILPWSLKPEDAVSAIDAAAADPNQR